MAKTPKTKGTKGTVKRSLTAAPVALLKQVRGASHVGFDRVVFEFDGPLPVSHSIEEVPEITGDPSGITIPVIGKSFLSVTLSGANGHDEDGNIFTSAVTTLGLPNVIQVVRAGDFEAVLSFGIGLAKREQFSSFTLTNPSRVVIDIAVPFSTLQTRIFFVDSHRFEIGQEPYVHSVLRPVIAPNVGARSLDWLFAGPTPSEIAGGLTFVHSEATGYSSLSVTNRVARVRLQGGADSHGSTLTIANEIFPLLKQFPTVRWVKIYDPSGQTQTPNGLSDSVPEGLEP